MCFMNFNYLTWRPIAIDSFGFLNDAGYPALCPSNYVRIYTHDGGMISAKRCPLPERLTCSGSKPALYCSRDGHFFSLTNNGTTLNEIKPALCKKYLEGGHRGGSAYHCMSKFGGKACHHLMYETWVGPRTKGMEIDHLNGNKLDWSLDNLEEVTPAENHKRAKLLRILRSIGRDPKQMSRTELQAIFRKYRFDKVKM